MSDYIARRGRIAGRRQGPYWFTEQEVEYTVPKWEHSYLGEEIVEGPVELIGGCPSSGSAQETTRSEESVFKESLITLSNRGLLQLKN